MSASGGHMKERIINQRTEPARQSSSSIASIIGLGGGVRIQDPELQKTKGQHPRWVIRAWVERQDGRRAQERFYLGRCDEVTKREAVKAKRLVMDKINQRQWLVAAQTPFGDLIAEWLKTY